MKYQAFGGSSDVMDSILLNVKYPWTIVMSSILRGNNGYVVQTYVIWGNGSMGYMIKTLDIIEKSYVIYGTTNHGGLLGESPP